MKIDRTNGARFSWDGFRHGTHASAHKGSCRFSRLGIFGPLDVIQANYSASLQTDDHDHEWSSFHLVCRGNVEDHFGTTIRAGQAGSLLFYPQTVAHRTRISDSGSKLFHFPLWREQKSRADKRTPPRYSIAFAESLSQIMYVPLMRLLVEVLEAGHSLTKLKRSGLEIQEQLLRVEASLESIAELPMPGANLRLATAASACGYSKGHFARRVRQLTGMSYGSLRKHALLKVAIRALFRGEECLAKVSHTAGFADQSHMGRIVRAELRTTPRRLQQIVATLI